ncbi:hypothetical protein [Saccharopolyspora sp. 5N708]|uniref:hypothetical protein n=1 Tax=Saccharopolyspora sp. 5N708 TaxID=3457424 RepID=UPI003FD4DF92
MTTTIKRPARRWWIVAIVVGFFLVVGAVSISGLFGSSAQGTFTSDDTTYYSETQTYSGPPIQRFTPADAQQLAQGLAEAEKLHGVCFGWKLVDGSSKQFDQGSSRGPNVPANTCPRWAETQVFVAAASSDDDQAAAEIKVEASDGFSSAPNNTDFVSLGVTADTLAADPVTVTGQAALGLPLLMVEGGALNAPRVPDTAPGNASVSPLPPSDGSGSNWVTWAWLAGLGVVVLLGLLLGFRARAKQKSTSDTPVGPPPPRPPQPPMPPGPPPPPGGGQQPGWPGPPPGPAPYGPPPGPPPPGPPRPGPLRPGPPRGGPPPPWPPPPPQGPPSAGPRR